jgi:hypothetical protein
VQVVLSCISVIYTDLYRKQDKLDAELSEPLLKDPLPMTHNVVCVYLVLTFEILQLANNCCSIKIKSPNDILQPALNKHSVSGCSKHLACA